jgi:glycerol uptake facilitator-like aquaporin
MNIITIIGIIIIVLGAVGLIYGGITYTSSSNAVDMGPMHIEVNQKQQVPVTPIAGAAAIVGGIILIIVGRRRPASGSAL